MVAAIDHDDDRSEASPEVEALQATIAAYKADNARLRAENDALRRGSPDDDRLQPLKALVDDVAVYERARRAVESGLAGASDTFAFRSHSRHLGPHSDLRLKLMSRPSSAHFSHD
jgi:hypothetical protein